MTIRLAADADIPSILRLLSLVPHPPNISARRFQHYFENDIVYVDSAGKAAVRLHKSSGEDAIVLPWWLWDGTDKSAHQGVLLAACLETVLRWPGSGAWPISGVLDGAGDTKEAIGEASLQALVDISQGLTEITMAPHEDSNYHEGRSTIGAVVAWLQGELSG